MEELKDLNPSNWQYCKEAVLVTVAVGGKSVTVALPVATIFQEVERQFKLPPVVGGPLVVGGLFSSVRRRAKKMTKGAVRTASKQVRRAVETKAAQKALKVSEKVARAYARPEVAMVARGVATAGIPIVSSAAGGVAAGSEATAYALREYDRVKRYHRQLKQLQQAAKKRNVSPFLKMAAEQARRR